MDHQSIMKLHLLTLKFFGDSSNLETPFQREYFRASLPHNRAALVVGAIFYSVFGILDVLLMPENKSTTWLIRFAIVDPVVIVTLLLSFSKSFERYVNPLMACVSILAGGGIICMIVIAPPPVNYSYYAGLLLVFMWCYAFIRISFLWASFAGWMLVVLYEIAAIWISPTPFAVLLNNNFFFISANLIGMIVCYSLEYYTRRNFFLTRQVEMEREKIDRINRELESQTVEYQIVNRTLEQEITERRKVEEALRESEKKFRSVVERSLIGIAIIDDAFQYAYVNEEFCNMTGYGKQELLGKNFTFLLAEESKLLVAEINQRRQRGEDVPSQYEFSFVQKNGEKRIGEVRSAVYLDSSGKVKVIIQVIDITDRKQAEEEKQSLEERLNRAEKMEALGIMAGGVAHDLNNVLGIVVGYAEMLLDDADKTSSINPRLMKIMEGGQKAAAIVQDMLTLARRGVSGRQVLNLNTIIADCQQSPEFEKLSSYHPSVRIKADCDPALLNISGSSVHLGKTLFNLVSNASEAMPNGGIVTIKTANVYLEKPIQGYDEIREGDYVVLSISDTGEGIPAVDLKRIFEPFYTKKVMGRSGTGLGLAVVWGTVKDHNGYLNVQSGVGQGSTFTLYFPVTREDISAEAVAISPSEYMGRGESILIVDDVEAQRDLAADILRKLNYSVTSVSCGEKAIAYLKDHCVDLMVLDMIMDPGMDGLDTYRTVHGIHPKQKAIIVSGFSESDRVKAAQALGAGAYVRKPYVIEKLGMAVRKELDRSVDTR